MTRARLVAASDPDPGHLLLPVVPRGWNQQGLNPFSHYTPSLGYYDTSAVVPQHVAAMQSAGVQAGIASWWGQGTPTDGRVPALLNAAGSFRWALYYEQEGSGNPTSATIAADLAYISAKYAKAPGYLRVGGKPVIFVYGDGTDGCGMADRWKAVDAAFYVVLKVFPGYTTCANQPTRGTSTARPPPRTTRPATRSRSAPASGRPTRHPTTHEGRDPMADQRRGHGREPRAVAARRHLQRVGRRLGLRGHDAAWDDLSNDLGRLSVPPLRPRRPARHPHAATDHCPTPTDPDAYPTGGTDPVIAAAGDIACDPTANTGAPANCDQAATAQQIVNLNPTAVLTLGDNQYESNTASQYAASSTRRGARSRPRSSPRSATTST
jgi:hypothetical protein